MVLVERPKLECLVTGESGLFIYDQPQRVNSAKQYEQEEGCACDAGFLQLVIRATDDRELRFFTGSCSG